MAEKRKSSGTERPSPYDSKADPSGEATQTKTGPAKEVADWLYSTGMDPSLLTTASAEEIVAWLAHAFAEVQDWVERPIALSSRLLAGLHGAEVRALAVQLELRGLTGLSGRLAAEHKAVFDETDCLYKYELQRIELGPGGGHPEDPIEWRIDIQKGHVVNALRRFCGLLRTIQTAGEANAQVQPTKDAQGQKDDGRPFYKPAYFEQWNIGNELLRRNGTNGKKCVEGKVRRVKRKPATGKGKRRVYWYSEPDARKRWPDRFEKAETERKRKDHTPPKS